MSGSELEDYITYTRLTHGLQKTQSRGGGSCWIENGGWSGGWLGLRYAETLLLSCMALLPDGSIILLGWWTFWLLERLSYELLSQL